MRVFQERVDKITNLEDEILKARFKCKSGTKSVKNKELRESEGGLETQRN